MDNAITTKHKPNVGLANCDISQYNYNGQKVVKKRMRMDNIYLREQKEMKLQISEIVSMITELKDDLTNLSDEQKELSKTLSKKIKSAKRNQNLKSKDTASVLTTDPATFSLRKELHEREEEQEIAELLGERDENESDESNEEDSQMDGLALLQKFIDEDNNSKHDFERECVSDNDDWNADHFGELVVVEGEYEPKTLQITDGRSTEDGDIKNNSRNANLSRKKGENTAETCEICDVVFLTKDEYSSHEKIHFTKKTYDCTLCDSSFVERVDFAEHFIRCFREAKAKGSLNLKEKSCTICGGYYADEISLKKHMSFHSECRLFPCSLCSFRYYSDKALQQHMTNVHNRRNKFHCPLCDFSFVNSCYLLTHIAVHSGTRPFCCNLCNYKADTKKALKQHFSLHANSTTKLFNCKECSFVCESRNVLFRHRISTHRDPVTCEFCGKVFNKTSAYKRHYQIHTNNNKIIKCELCKYETPFLRYMKKHMSTHPVLSTHQCSYCGISISSQTTLSHHENKYCLNRPSVS